MTKIRPQNHQIISFVWHQL